MCKLLYVLDILCFLAIIVSQAFYSVRVQKSEGGGTRTYDACDESKSWCSRYVDETYYVKELDMVFIDTVAEFVNIPDAAGRSFKIDFENANTSYGNDTKLDGTFNIYVNNDLFGPYSVNEHSTDQIWMSCNSDCECSPFKVYLE